jgi:uncharacterized membrane protein (DUF485 family)
MMEHGPAVDYHECDELLKYKQKTGLRLFFIYSVIYAVFVLLNTAFPHMMESVVIFGLNLAIVYGFGLIIIAVLLGLVYNRQCTNMEKRLDTGGKKTEGGSG